MNSQADRQAIGGGQAIEGGEQGGGVSATDRADEVIARAVATLEAVDRALARVLEGTSGTCKLCGSPIGRDVLDDDPVADACAGCAGARQTAVWQPDGTPGGG